MSVSIKDVARAAGVSIASVSRVLTGKPGVSTENEKRIRDVMDQLGYRPNMSARGLAKKQTGNIAVMLPKVSFVNESSYYSTILTGVASIIDQKEYNLILSFTNEQKKRVMAMQTVDGIILVSPKSDEVHSDWLKEIGLPIVMIGNHLGLGTVPCVRPDLEDGFRQVIRMLYKAGHRSIALLYDAHHALESYNYLIEYQKACDELQWYDAKQSTVEIAGYDVNRLTKTISKYLGKNKDITAVICATEALAFATIKAVHSTGWTVPTDLSIVSLGDVVISEYATPSLSTLYTDVAGMGKKAASLLIEQIQGKKIRKQDILFKMDVLNRGSIANPRE